MGVFIKSVEAVLLIVLMISVGYFAGRFKLMREQHKGFVVKLLINIAVPAMCVSNVFQQFADINLAELLRLMLVPLFSMSATLALSLILVKLFKISRARSGPFVVMCAFSNSIFMGLPICREIFGDAAVPYVIIFYIFNTLMFWTVGVALIQRSGDMASQKRSASQVAKRLLTPPLVSLLASIVLLLLGVKLPNIVVSFCDYLGDTVSPLALMYVGFVMYETGIKQIKLEPSFIAVTLMRYVVAPLITVVLTKLFLIPSLPANVFTLESAMPVMTQCVIMSAASNADERYSASAMTLSTLLSFISIPLIMLELQYI